MYSVCPENYCVACVHGYAGGDKKKQTVVEWLLQPRTCKARASNSNHRHSNLVRGIIALERRDNLLHVDEAYNGNREEADTAVNVGVSVSEAAYAHQSSTGGSGDRKGN